MPPIQFRVAVETASESELLAQTEAEILKEIGRTRTRYGLGEAETSTVLTETAEYLSFSMQEMDEADPAGAESYVCDLAEEISYVSVCAAVCQEDYFCTDTSLAASYFCRLLERDSAKAPVLLQSGICAVGVSLTTAQRDGKTVTCLVVCAATRSVAATESRVPADYTEPDIVPPVAEAETLYLQRGTPLTDERILDAISWWDERGEKPSFVYDATSVDITCCGEQPLSVTVRDAAGNETVCTVTVCVAEPIAPQILTETLYLPEIPGLDFWDPAAYVEAADTCAIAAVYVEPLAVLPSLRPAEARISVTNVFGVRTEKTVRIEYYAVSCAVVGAESASGGAGLQLLTLPKTTVKVGTPVQLQCTAVSDAVYTFTVREENGVSHTFIREENSLTWHPRCAGDTTVSVSVRLKKNGKVYRQSQLNIYVAERPKFVYNSIVLRFSAESELLLNAEDGTLSGLNPGMTVAEVRAAALLLGGTGSAELSFGARDGSVLSETDVLGTGATVSVTDGGQTAAAYTVLMYGDLNGNGEIDVADFAKMRQEILNGNLLTETERRTADLNGNGETDVADFAMLRQCILGNLEISQQR